MITYNNSQVQEEKYEVFILCELNAVYIARSTNTLRSIGLLEVWFLKSRCTKYSVDQIETDNFFAIIAIRYG